MRYPTLRRYVIGPRTAYRRSVVARLRSFPASGNELEHHEQDSTPDQAGQLPQIPPVLHPQPARDDAAPQPSGEPAHDAHDRSHSRADPGQGEQEPINVMAQERETE